MKSLLVALSMAVAAVSLAGAPLSVEAKRLGGGRPAGMQRQAPPSQPAQPPAQKAPTAAPQNAPAGAPAAAAAAGKRSWLGPIAGIAAGLGLAALMSHLGLSEAFGSFLLMALLAVVALVAVRWFMARRAGPQRPLAGGWQLGTAGAGAGGGTGAGAGGGSFGTHAPGMARRDVSATGVNLPPLQPISQGFAGAGAAVGLPDGVDPASFERLAKMVFIRLQAANDAGAVDDLRKFTTPELFASLRLDLQERGAVEQHTDVVELDATLVDTARENDQWVASVRFRGLIREERGAEAVPFDELWHLVKPVSGPGDWAIAGITPQG